MTDDFRFSIPDALRSFTRFPSLPPELRQEIWHSVVSEPGIHFVRFGEECSKLTWVSKPVQRQGSSTDGGSHNVVVNQRFRKSKQEGAPRRILGASLTPLESNPKADISYYKELREKLAKIAAVCKESSSYASSLISRPGTLTFRNGDLISLQSSQDVVYIEYFPMELYETGCSLGVDPFCPYLRNIRRVAVKFCHRWQEAELPVRCKFCRQVHSSGSKKSYPTHLYQFLARCFPNLEQVWLVDYFLRPRIEIFPRPRVESSNGPNVAGQGSDCITVDERNLERFRCHGRIYHEATPGLWNMKADSMELKAWLQERFVRHAKYSTYSRVNSPERVKFGFLGCDWRFSNPSPAIPPGRKISKNLSCTGRNKRSPNLTRRLVPAAHQPAGDVQHGGGTMTVVGTNAPFVFGQGRHYEFNLELGSWKT